MKGLLKFWLEIILVSVLVYLILQRPRSFSTVLASIANFNNSALRTLQGRD